MKLCWLLTTFQSDVASAHRRPSLVSDNMFLRVGFSRCLHSAGATGVVFMQPGVKVKVHRTITVMSSC